MQCRVLIATMLFLYITQDLCMPDDLLAQLVSPQVHDDGSVTFRVHAPQAERVLVKGILGQAPQALLKGEKGIWEGTVGPLPPRLYSYVFEIDGADQIDPHNRDVKKWLSLESLVEVPGSPPQLYEQTNVPHGTIHKHWYNSTTIGDSRPVVVYTPPGYQTGRGRSYPVVYLLHGYGDDEAAWIEVGRANWIADNLIAQERLKPVVIVMPFGHLVPIAQAVSFDDYAATNLTQMEADLIESLAPFIDANYRLADDRQQRAIVGLSMGGGQSLTIGLKHLDRFARIGAFSSAAPQGKSAIELVDASRVAKEGPALLWVGCGKDDPLLARNQAFVQQLKQSAVPHTYAETEGGHNWILWRDYLATFLSRSFPGAP